MTPEQIAANIAAADWELTPEQLESINAIAAYEAGGIRGPERPAAQG
jgi:diketogulonate reductase-like aldo/keto reductase